MDITIKYDVPFEVNEKQYKALVADCSGIVSHRITSEGKFEIKVWIMSYVKYVKMILKANE